MTTDSNTDAAREKRIGFNVRIERQFDPDFDPPCPRRVIGGGLAWYVVQSPASAPEQASVGAVAYTARIKHALEFYAGEKFGGLARDALEALAALSPRPSDVREQQAATICGRDWTGMPIIGPADKVAEMSAQPEQQAEQIAKLQRFKDWIHAYLDAQGVPHHPPGTHGAEGCRIGDRMDWLMDRLRKAESQQAEQGDGEKPATEAALTFNDFRRANVARCIKWHHAGINSWSASDWLTAVTGELGELASLLKMCNRERDGLPGNKFSPTRKMIADELADVLTYLDLLAASFGIDLGNAAVEKFNEVSERVGFSDRLRAVSLAALTQPPRQSEASPPTGADGEGEGRG
jgi:NTP pyrophosphatase (non-canonical NTP hydrolase)